MVRKRTIIDLIELGVLVMFHLKKKPVWQKMVVETFEELHAQEREILHRIQETPNGGILFALNPLRMLEDIQVHLSDDLREAWLEREPRLLTLRESDYERMKANPVLADVKVKVRGLFHQIA